MGIYLNPGLDAFQMAVNNPIYVDKTELIHFVNSRIGIKDRFLCVSRPRRFGKSMTAEMLAAYYSKGCDSSGIFNNLKISGCIDYEKYLNKLNVIYLNIQQFLRPAGKPKDLVYCLEKSVLEELKEVYQNWIKPQEESLSNALMSIYSKDKGQYKGFVFIIDEWDCVFRIARDNSNAQKLYLDFLRDLFKDRIYVKAAYMTGILPIKKYGNHSALNDFDEFSMTRPGALAEYVGFTEQEVRNLCEEYHKDFKEVQFWYDGYELCGDFHIYNPKSVVSGMQSKRLQSFWTNTETYEALQIYIDLDKDRLKQSLVTMLGGGFCLVDTGAFQNDMTTFRSRDDIFTLLVHLGYLSYHENTKTVSIPNEEVRQEFVRAVKNGKHTELAKLILNSDILLQNTWNMDSAYVAAAIQEAHSAGTAPIWYNNEQALRSVIRFAYLSCVEEYQEIQELPSGTGYADIVYLPKKGSVKPVLLIELKWNKSAESAIQQIKERNYPQVLKGYGGEILLVGISYNADTKQHFCKIEKYKEFGKI